MRRAMKRVMAFGTFDLLHAGHRYYLRRAKALGDVLIVVVARNKSVKKAKGRLPVHNETQRLQNVKKLKFVGRAVLGSKKFSHTKLVMRFNPGIIALGYDQKPSIGKLRLELRSAGWQGKIVRIPAYKPGKFHTSKIRAGNKNKK